MSRQHREMIEYLPVCEPNDPSAAIIQTPLSALGR